MAENARDLPQAQKRELDLQVPPEENLKAIEAALKEGGNKDFTVKEFLGLNHLFQPAQTGLILSRT